jgi:hypothetical protein
MLIVLTIPLCPLFTHFYVNDDSPLDDLDMGTRGQRGCLQSTRSMQHRVGREHQQSVSSPCLSLLRPSILRPRLAPSKVNPLHLWILGYSFVPVYTICRFIT